MGSKPFDPDLFGCGCDDGPDCPVSRALSDFAALADGAQQGPFFDSGRRLPGVNALLDPHGHGDGSDTPALAGEVGDDPAVFVHLDVRDGKRGQFPSPQRAADKQGEDAVGAFTFEGGAVAASSAESIPFFRASVTSFRTAAKRTFTVKGARVSMEARYSMKRARVSCRSAAKANSRSSALA